MKKKKTIVFVQNVEYPQQWAIDIFYYSKYLSQYKEFNIKVIISKINENIKNKDLEIIELWKINYFKFILKSFFEIKKLNKKSNIDYVHFFSFNPFSVLLQFCVKYFLWLKTIYDVISWPIWKWLIYKIWYFTVKLWIFLSDKYILDHIKLKKVLNIKDNNKKFEIIWIWYDDKIFNEKKWLNLFNKKGWEIIFTYIWTLNKERNLDIFIRAFKENFKKYKNIKLYFIWYWNWEENLKEVSWKYLNKNIFFLWKKEHKKIPDYINSSDIMVSYVPKIDYFEYQPPTKLIEYLACNKPVIVTNTIAQEEIMRWFEDLICRDDLEWVKNKIEYFINNFDKVKNRNYVKLVENYSWEKLVGKLNKLFNF